MAHLQGMNATEKRRRVLRLAQEEGMKAGGLAGLLSCAGVVAANKFSPWFRKSTSVSAKTALAVSPFFLFYLLRTELVMHGANHDPHAYGIVDDIVGSDGTTRKSKILQPRKELNAAQQLANWCYVNPFKMVVGMGVPAVGGILYSMRNEGNLKLSQKLIHTRVYGQMTVVSMAVAMMAFQETMRRRGGLFVVTEAEEEEEEEEVEGAIVPRSK
ncbi:unnamed protein product [Ectocarpus sp. 6 AP-2014]